MPKSDVELKRWKRTEYEQLVEKGVFATGDRVELIDGLLIVAEPQSATHYTTIKLVERALARAFGEDWHTRSQAPIALDENSEPEPDVAVVRGGLRDYVAAHPADPALVVEIALTSLALDREHKASLYARAGRAEYWIVNLVDRVLEVYRDPGPSPTAPYGWDYRAMEAFGAGDTVRPLAAPSTAIAVDDLLP